MNADLFEGFSQAEIAAAIAAKAEERELVGQAQAHRRKHKAITRRVKNDEMLAKLMPARVEPGESWHILSTGDVDVLSFTRYLLKGYGHFDSCVMSTWRINTADIEEIARWIDAGLIGEWHLIIDRRFERLAPDSYAAVMELNKAYDGAVTVSMALNHSKLTLLSNAEQDVRLVIESSANVNTNHRLENTAIHADHGLHDFYAKALNGIRLRYAKANS